ncbi:hypothetical protein QIH80_21115 [Bradyrhizobium elkanii]|nr:hypothetical protein QIH80_21115 [Bradyrhizobium elkanii]
MAIPLPYPPLIDIVSVKYFDANGVDQTMVLGTDFRVLGMGQPLGQQEIAPPLGKSWPVARLDDASVRIRFNCGYDEDVNVMPRQLKSALCLAVRDLLPLLTRDQMLLEDRVEGVSTKRYQNNPQLAAVVQSAIGSLLANLRVD